MDNAMDRLRNSKAVRMLFALALALGLWPATSLASAIPAYASDGDEPAVDVEGYVKAQADSSKVGEESGGFLWFGGQELHGTGKYLLVKHTYAQNLEAGDSIYAIMTDVDQCAEKVIAVCLIPIRTYVRFIYNKQASEVQRGRSLSLLQAGRGDALC